MRRRPCVGDMTLTLDVREHAISYAPRLLRTAGFPSSRRGGPVCSRSTTAS
ncbi:hypothetical protein G3R41_08990 [Modestobacter muralis]|uniref:Uncharacterized protein n=1 Tax=Modestobacter muralis TaxID=1608614 RepID=A0A6P0H7F2_9ACTN|nr:hypothetical protein [Modestobacter muralis]NEN51073.1 hypothetical protein [Modestobacter muralis]